MKSSKVTVAPGPDFVQVLESRFRKNLHRHIQCNWIHVAEKLHGNPSKLAILYHMESTGGEPDVVSFDLTTGEFIFCDCSPESPSGRRSICYDHQALGSRKQNKPVNSAMNMAKEIGIELLTERQYLELQLLEKFDRKTSSWILTPPSIRELGGAIFGDRRYERTFIYHNGAESYFEARGFRGILRV